ncbi:MAG: YvcK family protein [Candidatus Goldbacteria bacterium]|nr:YvcK family protein [Candidatus Goldiibacteriota bacterium]
MQWLNKWLYPGIKVKRWLILFILSFVVMFIGFSGLMGSFFNFIKIDRINIDNFFYRLHKLKAIDYILFLLGLVGMFFAIRRTYFSIFAIFGPHKEKEFINIAYQKAKLKRGPKIVAIGGGTGMPNVLRGLKQYTLNLSAIVTVADDGGSSGRLRKDYSVLPPGDLRNCIVALADEETLLGKLFQYRFEKKGDLAGHNLGNLFLTALTHIVGDLPKAINESSKVLAVSGKVYPVTLDNIVLKARLKDGRKITGESNIPKARGIIEKVYISPSKCKPYPMAINAIKAADIITIGPGSLFTSIIPNLLVPGIVEAIVKSKALKVYICNIMTQPGETDNFRVSDHIKAIFNHVGIKIVDYVIANNKLPDKMILKKYARENSYPVEIDKHEISRLGVKLFEGQLFKPGKYIRHDPELLSKMIMKLILV